MNSQQSSQQITQHLMNVDFTNRLADIERRLAKLETVEQANKQEHQFKAVSYGFREDENGNRSIGEIPQREWVGLTDEERRHYNNRLSGSGVAEDIEAKLKERNNG